MALTDTPKDTLTQRVIEVYKELIKLNRIKNKSAFAQIVGFPQQYFARFEAGTRRASVEHATAIVVHFGVSLDYLIRGEGPMFKPSEEKGQRDLNSTVIPVGAIEPAGYAYLHFVPIVARATFAEMGDTPRVDEFDTIAVPIQPNDDLRTLEKCWVFEVNGDSMEDTLHHGQRIVAQPINEGDWEYQSDRVYVVSYAGYLVVKRIKTNDLRKHNYLELWSDNEKKGGMKVAQRREIKGIWKVLRLDRAPEIY
jgi:phage repressor protein C with HTH and peptisase S24 domain